MEAHPHSSVSGRQRFEARWPVIAALACMLALLTALPGRIKLLPDWTHWVAFSGVAVPMLGVWITRGESRWMRAERWSLLAFLLYAGLGTPLSLANLMHDMISRSAELTGLQLFTSSIVVWSSNMLVFALVYWQIDRGGPEARVLHESPRPDWQFPQEQAAPDAVEPDWTPRFMDYLYLAFETSTSFGTTDAPPLTCRAKLLMMTQASISLLATVVVAARAINIIG